MNFNKQFLPVWIQYLLLACISAPLIIHAWLGQYSRYYGDDFCFQVQLKSKGIINAALFYYYELTGRYSDMFWEHFSGYFNTHIFYSPAAFLLIWSGALLFIIYKLSGKNKDNIIVCAIIALSILFAAIDFIPKMYYRRTIDTLTHTWDGYPGIFQSLYWIAGRNRLILPLILTTLNIGFIYQYVITRNKGESSNFLLFIIAFITFFCGGFGETYVTLQTMVYILTLLIVFIINSEQVRKSMLIPLGTGLLFSLLSMMVIILAPGNDNRAEYFSQPDTLGDLLFIAWNGLFSTAKTIFKWPGNVLTLIQHFLISIFMGMVFFSNSIQLSNNTIRKLMYLIPIGILVLQYTAFLPAAYGISKEPPAREMIVINYFILSIVSYWCILIGIYIKKNYTNLNTQVIRYSIILVISVFSINGMRDAVYLLKNKENLQTFAAAYDDREKLIIKEKTEGKTKVIVPEIKHFIGGAILTNDSTHWINECISDYYGIPVLTKSE
jgi:hypothetical protein